MEYLRENEPIERHNSNDNNLNNNINIAGEVNNNINNHNNNQNIGNNNINNNNGNVHNNNNINNNLNNNNINANNNNINENNNNDNNNNVNNNANNNANNFNNFNLNNLNYNRFRHVLHTDELEFLLNKKYSKSLWEIICTLTFTKNCHKISFSIILFLFFCIAYLFTFMNYRNSSIIIKLESEESYFEIIIWMINIGIIIITWNFYLFLFTTIFGYTYSKNVNNNIRSSFVEDFYKNPFGFILLLYYYDNKILKNVIDNSFWALLGFEYSFIHYNLNQFYIQFYKELNSITDFKNQNIKKIKKINFISIFFLLAALLLIIFNYMIIEVMSFFHKLIFLSKGIFLLYKIIELWKIYLDEYKFLESNMDIKEKIFFNNLRTKSFLELGSMIFIFLQISILLINGDSAPFYFNIIIIYFIVVLSLQTITYYRKYKEIRDYFLKLDQCLQKEENIPENDDECIICTEKMTTARKLTCHHRFHLICLSKWFENGHNSCPICRTEINFSVDVKKLIRNRIRSANNDENQYRNRIFSFSLNSNLFSWLPNFSLRIIRFYNNDNNNANIIINNHNINRINLNLQRADNNQNQRQNQN